MKRVHRPSPAMTVALVALFVAMGGTGYAALKLPKNSVGSKQIKKNAVTSSKVRDGSLRARDFPAGQLPAGAQGPQGLPGAPGEPGAPGTAVAYAFVESDGNVDEQHSKGITDAMVTHQGAIYCFDLPFAVQNVIATPGTASSTAYANGDAQIATTLATGDVLPSCSGEDVVVVTRNGSNAFAPLSFFLMLN